MACMMYSLYVVNTTEQIFHLSCGFSNDSQLHYFCYDPSTHDQKGANLTIKLNTFGITECLCGNYIESQGESCKNISLYFLKSQEAGLCVAVTSNTRTLKQIMIRLLHYNIYYHYFPTCIDPQLQLQYEHAFSCITRFVNQCPAAELIFNISGYDTTVHTVWVSTLQIDFLKTCQNDIINSGSKQENCGEDNILIAGISRIISALVYLIPTMYYCFIDVIDTFFNS